MEGPEVFTREVIRAVHFTHFAQLHVRKGKLAPEKAGTSDALAN